MSKLLDSLRTEDQVTVDDGTSALLRSVEVPTPENLLVQPEQPQPEVPGLFDRVSNMASEALPVVQETLADVSRGSGELMEGIGEGISNVAQNVASSLGAQPLDKPVTERLADANRSVTAGVSNVKEGINSFVEKNISPMLTQPQIGGAQVTQNAPEQTEREKFNPLLDALKKYPSTTKQAIGGGFQALGGEDQVVSVAEDMKKRAEILNNPEANFLEKGLARIQLIGPGSTTRMILDTLDNMREKAFEAIDFTRVKPGAEAKKSQYNEQMIKEIEDVSLKDVFKEFGTGLSEAAAKEIEAGRPKDLSMFEEAQIASVNSVLDFATSGTALKLAGLLNAGSITGSFMAKAWMQIYDDTLESTGDPKRAAANATFGAIAEGAGEAPGMTALFKATKGDEFVKYIKRFIALDIGGEIGTELAQLGADIAYSDEGQANNIQENFNLWLDQAPRVAGITAMSAGMSSGTISGVAGATVKAAQSYEDYKYQQTIEGINKKNRVAAGESLALMRARIALQDDVTKMTDEKLKVIDTMEGYVELLNRQGNAIDVVQLDKPFNELDGMSTLGANSYHNNEHSEALVGLTTFNEAGEAVPYLARDKNPQVFFGMNTQEGAIKPAIRILETEVKQLKAARDQAVLNGEQGTANSRSELLNSLTDELTELRKRDYISGFLATEGVAFVRELQQTFAPELNMLLHDNTVMQSALINEQDNANGHMNVYQDGSVALMVNPTNYLKEVELNSDGTLKKLSKNKLMETISHEFGHAMAYHLYNKSPDQVKMAIKKAYESYRQEARKLYNDPNATDKDLQRLGRGWAITRDERKRGIGRGKRSAKESIDLERLTDFFKYVHSFDEWFAHEMERAYLGQSEVNKIARNHLTRNAAILKSIHNKAKNIYAPSEIFNTFLKFAIKDAERSTRSELENLLESDKESIEKANLTAIESIDNVVKDINAFEKDFDLDQVVDPKAGLDKFNKFISNVYTLTQIAEENPHIPELQNYVRAVELWWAEKSKWNTKAIGTVEAWQGIKGKDMADRIAKFALAVTLESDNMGRQLTGDELQELNSQKKYQLDDDAFGVWEQIDQDFRDALGYDEANPQGLYKALLADIKRVHAANPEAAMEAMLILNKEMVEMSNRNFFPLSRFGRYKVTVRATDDMVLDGITYNKGDVIAFETFEDTNDQTKATQEYMRMLAGKAVNVSPGILRDTGFAYASMPPNLIAALRNQLGLTSAQQEELDDILLKQTTASRFKKHLLQRSGVPGFSQDAMRGYASYMANFANAVARMQFAPLLQSQITGLENTLESISSSARNPNKTAKELRVEANKRAEMVSYLTQHFEYVMNPGNELANLRSVAFLWYLGFMPASAAVNLTQIPMVSWPYLSQRKELGGSTLSTGAVAGYQLTKATKDIMNIFKGKNVKFTPGENEMFQELVARGILDESQAQELAGFSEGSNLQRMLPDKWGFGKFKTRRAAGTIRNMSYAGAFLFHHAEKFNRNLTALAAFRMGIKEGLSTKQAIEEAHLAVRETQFEYARWNRPKMMRGPKSVVFMFKMYLENILYFMAKGDGGRRTLLLFFLVNGLQGGPGSEDMMDIYDFLVNKWNKKFGDKGARTAIREDLREVVNNLGLDPNMVMHGVGSKYGLGLAHMLEFAGVPVPNVNIAGRTSLGRVIPGLGPLLQPDQDTFGRATAEASGAVVAVPLGIMQALSSDNPDTWKNMEKGMPAIARYMSQAGRFLTRGEETRYDGGTLQSYNVSDPLNIDHVKIGLHAAGFMGDNLSRLKERDWARKQMLDFFSTRKGQILNQFAKANLSSDREGIADMNKAVTSYNESIPFPSLSISGKDISNSTKRLNKSRVMGEMGLPTSRREIPAVMKQNELYPVTEEGVK